MNLTVFEVVLILKMVIEPMCNILLPKIRTLVCLWHKIYVQILIFFPHLRFIALEILE